MAHHYPSFSKKGEGGGPDIVVGIFLIVVALLCFLGFAGGILILIINALK